MKILITGSQGFIGSKVVKDLLNQGHKVTGVDTFDKIDSKEPWAIERNKIISQNLKNPKFEFIKWDLLSEHKFYSSEQERLYEALGTNPDIIIHCAAIVGVENHLKDTSSFLKNLQLDERVIRWCNKSHLIYFSTSEVYGDTKKEMSVLDDLRISSKLRSNYALEKLFVERIIQAKLKNYTILRPFNVTGPSQSPNLGVIPKFVSLAKRNKDITVYRASQDAFEPRRTFLSIDDFVYGLDFIIRHLNKYNRKIVNIGSENSIGIHELAEIIKSKFKSKSGVLRKIAESEDNVITYRKPYTTVFDDMNLTPKGIDEIINEFVGVYNG